METIAGIALVAAAIIVVVNIVVGKLTGTPLRGTYEMVGLCCSIMASMAIPMATLMNGHVAVDIFVQSLGKKAQMRLEYFAKLMDAAIGVSLAYAALRFALKMLSVRETTDTLSIPVWPFRFVWTLCGVLIVAFSIYNICMIPKKYQGRILSQAEEELQEVMENAAEIDGEADKKEDMNR